MTDLKFVEVPEGTDPFLTLHFEGERTATITIAFEGDWVTFPGVAPETSETEARETFAGHVFSLVYDAVTGGPSEESDQGASA